ncbi:hypothetical protein Tco_1242354, partial [Tanacetum coccineum]
DRDFVVEPMTTNTTSQPARSSTPSSSSSSASERRPPANSGSTTLAAGTSTPSLTPMRWDRQTIQFFVNAWAPVVVPLLPTLVHDLAEHNSSKFVVLACIIGLYSSVMIVQKFFSSLIGGVMLVLLIQSTNVLVGYVSISWPTISFSIDAVTLLKLFGEGLRFIGQGILTIADVALVEETLFRSWLPEEIDVDLGFNQGIILSGLACSLCHWYSF